MAVGTVKIDLEASTAKFEKQMQSFSKKLDKDIKKITNGLKAIGIAAVAAATGLGVLTKSAINTNDELSKLSQKLGISTEDLSALAFAGEFSGVSLGNLDGALSALTRRFNNFDRTGGGAAKDAFTDLGIATRDTEGNLRDINDVFLEVAEKISKMEAGIEKTALVQDIFSKSQAKIIPLLNEGKDGLEAFRKQAEKLGLILDQRTAKASEQFNDQLDRLGKQVTGFGAKLAEKLLPTLIRTTKEIETFADSADFKDVLTAVQIAVEAIIVAFKGLIVVLKGASIVFDVLAGNEERAKEKGKAFLKNLEDIQQALRDIVKGPDAKFDITKTGEGTGETDGGADLSRSADQVKSFEQQMTDFYKNLTDKNTQFANAFKNSFKGLEDVFVNFAKTGKLSFKDLTNSIIEDILRIAVKQAVIAPLVGGLFGKAGGGTGTGLFGGFFAKGGRPDTGKVSVVGEQGPELFIPDSAGRVIPNNKMGGGGNAPSVIFNIENNSGSPIQQDATTNFDGENLIVNTIISAVNNNKNGIRNTLKGIR
jgi:hypothetical protein